MLPAIVTKTSRMATAAITLYKGLFWRVIAATFNDDVELDEKIKAHHELPRNGSTAQEYCIQIKAYPERCHFEMDDHHLPTINLDWSQGTGFRIEVCGYSKYCCVHVQLKHVAFLELYCITPDNAFLNTNIKFADARKPSTLTALFLEQIALVKGCWFSTVEALCKYYCAAVKCHQRKEAYSLSSASGVQLEHPLPHSNFLSNVFSELSMSNIDASDDVVLETYKSAFQTNYGTFTLLGHHLLQPSDIRRL